jgi:exonuclease III
LGIRTGLFKTVREIKHDQNLEIVLVELTTISDSKILICSCYRPPNADRIWMENFEHFLNDVCSRHSKIVLAGDFNGPFPL